MKHQFTVRSLDRDRVFAYADIVVSSLPAAMAHTRRLIPARPDCAIIVLDPSGSVIWGHFPPSHSTPPAIDAPPIDDTGPEWGPPEFCLQIR